MEPREHGCHLQPSSSEREVGGKPTAPQGRGVLSSPAALLYSPDADGCLSSTVTLSPGKAFTAGSIPIASLGGTRELSDLPVFLVCDKGLFVMGAPNESH